MGPLEGIRIVEIDGIGPCPFGGMLLADLGAEVIRVGRPEPSFLQANFDVMSRGKKSITLDLKKPEHKAALLKVVETADALIEGFRPGVMERLGIGPEVCLEVNPRLVFGRMTGWGQEGPWAQRAGHDINYISLAGALHAIGRKGERPTIPLNLVGDFGGGGLLLAFGVLAALLETQKSGKGAGRGCRHGRRRRSTDGEHLCRHAAGVLDGQARREPARFWCSLLRRLRNERRKVRLDRLARTTVLQRARRETRHRRCTSGWRALEPGEVG